MHLRVTHRTFARIVAVAAALLAPAAARAQVGYPPAESPFVDLEYRQSVTPYVGYFHAAKDPAGIAPQGGFMVGLRYDLVLGGPASLTVRTASVLSERTVLDPARPRGQRSLGVEQRPLTLADVGLTINLTGQKSWHSLVPLIHFGGGLASNFRGTDPGGFDFGTAFAFAYGAGVRLVPPRSRWSGRVDLGNHMYQISYPDRYFAPGLDSTQVLPSGSSKSKWLNNSAVTVGVSYQFMR